MVQVAVNGLEAFSSWGTCITAGFNILPTALFLLNLDLVLESICHYQSKLAVMLKTIHRGLSQGCNFKNWIVNNSFFFGGGWCGIFTFCCCYCCCCCCLFWGPEKLSDIDKSLHLLYIYSQLIENIAQGWQLSYRNVLYQKRKPETIFPVPENLVFVQSEECGIY